MSQEPMTRYELSLSPACLDEVKDPEGQWVKFEDVTALLARVQELEREAEASAWAISPAMAQAKIDQLNQQLAEMTAERDAAEQQVAQLDHKNCDLMRRNRILRTRPDLPMTHEEKARYKQLENQVARLREMAEHAVNEEPEMPGEMPLALYEQIKQLDRAGMAEWARIIAWQTKAGVLGRLHALLETEGE